MIKQSKIELNMNEQFLSIEQLYAIDMDTNYFALCSIPPLSDMWPNLIPN